MQSPLTSMLLLYEADLPPSALLSRLTGFRVEFMSVYGIDQHLHSSDLPPYALAVVYAPGGLRIGRQVCDRVRRLSTMPILLLAPPKPSAEALVALQASADVLLPPDTDPSVIVGHIVALLRLVRGPSAPTPPPATATVAAYRDEHLEVDLLRRSVRVHGRAVHLTPTEFRLLALLVQHQGQVLAYDRILNQIWGWEASDHRVVHTFAAQVRAKLGVQGAEYIVNEYGFGYRFAPPPPAE